MKPTPVNTAEQKCRLNSPETPDGWIACGERLPKVGDVVLISIDGFISVGESVRSWGGYRYFTSVETGRELTATHWQPLPAPPATTEK